MITEEDWVFSGQKDCFPRKPPFQWFWVRDQGVYSARGTEDGD
jgi:hypothetical protein